MTIRCILKVGGVGGGAANPAPSSLDAEHVIPTEGRNLIVRFVVISTSGDENTKTQKHENTNLIERKVVGKAVVVSLE